MSRGIAARAWPPRTARESAATSPRSSADGEEDRAVPLRGRHAGGSRALRVARLHRHRGGQALHRLRHRPVPGQGVPRAGRDPARAAHRQTTGADPPVHVAPAARADADQAARGRTRRASVRGRSVIPGNEDDEDESRADHSGEVRLPATLDSSGPIPARAEIVIVGGGVMGLAIAYYLARRGLDDVVVIERGYLAEGASGRNGGGVRQQWSTEINIRLMQESVELCRRFAVDVGVNVWFRQGGYLFLARSAKEVARLEKNIAIQNRCGVATRMLDPEGARDIVPEIDLTGIVGAAYNPTDGILFPWPFLWGYARQAAAHGVRIFTQTPVQALAP